MLDIVEAHCYFVDIGQKIVSKYVAESITMIAGRFGHEGLCQLRIIVIDSARYLLMISSPDTVHACVYAVTRLYLRLRRAISLKIVIQHFHHPPRSRFR